MANNSALGLAALAGAAYLATRKRSTGPAAPSTGAISSPTGSSGVAVPLGQSSPTNIRPATEGVSVGQASTLPQGQKIDRTATRYSSYFDTKWTDGRVGPALPVTLNSTQYVVRTSDGQAWGLTAALVSADRRAVKWKIEKLDVKLTQISASGYSAQQSISVGKPRYVFIPWDKKPGDPVPGITRAQNKANQFSWWGTIQRVFTQQELVRLAAADAHPDGEIGGFDLIPTPGIGLVSSLPGIVGDGFQKLRGLF